MKNIVVSIVLYNTDLDDLNKLLTVLISEDLVSDILLIDNSPKNKLKKFVIDLEKIIYLHCPNNPGYGSGHNIGFRYSIKKDSKYHLVINPDIKLPTNTLKGLFSFLNLNTDVGLVMPRVLDFSGEEQKLCKLIPTPLDLILNLIPKIRIFNNRRKIFRLNSQKVNNPIFVPYLSGCFMLFRVCIIKKVGLFDERFFMYPEDIDISRRIVKHALTIFHPNFHVFHRHARESKKSFKMFLIHALNICKYFFKWGWIYDKSREEINKRALSVWPD